MLCLAEHHCCAAPAAQHAGEVYALYELLGKCPHKTLEQLHELIMQTVSDQQQVDSIKGTLQSMKGKGVFTVNAETNCTIASDNAHTYAVLLVSDITADTFKLFSSVDDLKLLKVN